MPELPELQVVAEVLTALILDQTIHEVEIRRPLTLRDITHEGFDVGTVGRSVSSVFQRGKFIVLGLEQLHGETDRTSSPTRWLAINPMLRGRLQLCAPDQRRLQYTQVTFELDGDLHLRYADRRAMGKLYLTDQLDRIPGWKEMGPDALDPELTVETFADRLRPYRGEIKRILVNPRFVAGIGNAYSDEVCFAAGLYPYRKRMSLGLDEVKRLHGAMRRVLTESVDHVRQQMGQDIHTKPRDFLAVHGKGGEPCPRCGTPISQITARQRLTNFCRRCQPGSLLTL